MSCPVNRVSERFITSVSANTSATVYQRIGYLFRAGELCSLPYSNVDTQGPKFLVVDSKGVRIGKTFVAGFWVGVGLIFEVA